MSSIDSLIIGGSSVLVAYCFWRIAKKHSGAGSASGNQDLPQDKEPTHHGFSEQEQQQICAILHELKDIPLSDLKFPKKKQQKTPKVRKLSKSRRKCPLCGKFLGPSLTASMYTMPWKKGLDNSSYYLASSFVREFKSSEDYKSAESDNSQSSIDDVPPSPSSAECEFCEILQIISATPGGVSHVDQDVLGDLLGRGINALRNKQFTKEGAHHALEKLFILGSMYRLQDASMLIPDKEIDKFPLRTLEKFTQWLVSQWENREYESDVTQRILVREIRREHQTTLEYLEALVKLRQAAYDKIVEDVIKQAKKSKEHPKTIEKIEARLVKFRKSLKSLRGYTRQKMENVEQNDWLTEPGLGAMALRIHEMPSTIASLQNELLVTKNNTREWIGRCWINVAYSLFCKNIGLTDQVERLAEIEKNMGRRYGDVGGDFEDLSRHVVLEVLIPQLLQEIGPLDGSNFEIVVFQNVNLPIRTAGMSGELDFLIVQMNQGSDVAVILAVIECKTQAADIFTSFPKQRALFEYLCVEKPDQDGNHFSQLRLGVNARRPIYIQPFSMGKFSGRSAKFLKKRLFYITRPGNIFTMPSHATQPTFKMAVDALYFDLKSDSFLKSSYAYAVEKWGKDLEIEEVVANEITELIQNEHVFVLEKYCVIDS